MILAQITYDLIRYDDNGTENERTTGERVYLRMKDDIAEAAKNRYIDFGLSLTMQHIAELQGYNFAEITDVTY